MYIGIQYQKNPQRNSVLKFFYVHRNSEPEQTDMGIQYQKKNFLGLYLLHHFTEFLQHKM
jgi:hypothetical protein